MTEAGKQGHEVLEVDFSRPVRLHGNRVGKLVAWNEAEGPIVDHSSNPHGPIAARSTVAIDAETARAAIENSQEVLLLFEAERSDRPIIVGLLQSVRSLRQSEAQRSPTQREATVDGRRIVFEARDEIVLRCGEASITLRRNGRVVVKGAYVETRAKGVNRIKGGVVGINEVVSRQHHGTPRDKQPDSFRRRTGFCQ